MIDKIYIPTLGRVGNQITWNILPDFVKEISVLAIPPKEENLHKQIPTVTVPDEYTGIAKTREWLWSISEDLKWGMFDDDLKFSVRTPSGETSKREFTNEDWKNLIDTTDSWLDDFLQNAKIWDRNWIDRHNFFQNYELFKKGKINPQIEERFKLHCSC